MSETKEYIKGDKHVHQAGSLMIKFVQYNMPGRQAAPGQQAGFGRQDDWSQSQAQEAEEVEKEFAEFEEMVEETDGIREQAEKTDGIREKAEKTDGIREKAVESEQPLKQDGFRKLVSKPELADRVLEHLHRLMEGKQKPQDVVKPIRAAMDAGAIKRPTWDEFCQEFGQHRIKSKSSLSKYTNPDMLLYHGQDYITMVADFKEMISSCTR